MTNDDEGEGGVTIPPKIDDVIYEQPLIYFIKLLSSGTTYRHVERVPFFVYFEKKLNRCSAPDIFLENRLEDILLLETPCSLVRWSVGHVFYAHLTRTHTNLMCERAR